MSHLSCWPVTTIVTHERPHLDELAAIWALRHWGPQRYRGIEGARIEFFDQAVHLDDRSEDAWLGDGYLFIGVRGGRFDDHPHERFPEDCAFTLVLKDLEIIDKHRVIRDPAITKIVRDVLTEDRKGSPCSLHLAAIIKARHRILPWQDTVRDAELSLEALYEQQRSFYEAVEVVRNSSPISVVNRPSGRRLVLVVAESDNEDISAAARWKEGAHAALVVHRHPDKPDGSGGITYISTNHFLGIGKLGWLAIELRRAEQEAKGEITVCDRKRLSADGVLPEVPEWYHHQAAGQLYNGSLTALHVPRTRLSLETITQLCVSFLQTEPVARP